MSRKNKQFKSHQRKRHITIKLSNPIKRSTVKRSALKHKTMKRKKIIGGSDPLVALIDAFTNFNTNIHNKILKYKQISNRN